MQRLKTFLVVCISIHIGGSSLAQTNAAGVDKRLPERLLPLSRPIPGGWAGHAFLPLSSPGSPAGPGIDPAPASPFYVAAMASQTPLTGIQAPGGAFYVDHLGFFCKKEIDFIRTTHIPLHFRLGSMEEANRLEGK
jgi:hypothetical protein